MRLQHIPKVSRVFYANPHEKGGANRIVDGFLFYVVAFSVVLVSPKGQRLGDIAAHTLVIPVWLGDSALFHR